MARVGGQGSNAAKPGTGQVGFQCVPTRKPRIPSAADVPGATAPAAPAVPGGDAGAATYAGYRDIVTSRMPAGGPAHARASFRGRAVRAAAAVTGVAFAIGALTACGSSAPSGVPEPQPVPNEQTSQNSAAVPDTTSFTVMTQDGREVDCVWAIQPVAGGLSCDWSHAHYPGEAYDSAPRR
jgi:hypothetical protein